MASVPLGATRFFENGPFESVEFGVDRQRRHKDYIINQDFLVLGGGPSLLLDQGATTALPIPASALEPTTDALGFMGIGPQVMYNPFSLLASGTLVKYPTALSSVSAPPDWVVNENDTTGYLQLNIHTDLGPSVGLRGNIGLQAAHTSQTSQGARVAPGSSTGGSTAVVLLPTSGGTSFTRYLPSLNLVFSLHVTCGRARAVGIREPYFECIVPSLSMSKFTWRPSLFIAEPIQSLPFMCSPEISV